MDLNLKLMADQRKVYPDPERNWRLVGKLIYLTITRLDISFAVGVVSQFMQNPHLDHWNVVMRILRYVKRLLVKGCCMKTGVIPNYRDIVMLIGLAVPWIEGLHQTIVSSLEEILFLGKARNRQLSLGPVQKLNIDL